MDLALIFQAGFVQNAFLAGTVVAIVGAIVGYFVVLRSQAFVAHSFAHVGFAGATGAALLGASALLGTLAFTLTAALIIGALGKRIRGRDIEIGMVLSFALGLGVLFLNLYTRYANTTVGVLFGSILSVSSTDVLLTCISSGVILLLLAFIFRPLLFTSVDAELAQTRGVPTGLLSVVFLLMLAVTVAETVKVVGVLLVFALLVAPAASAIFLTRRPLAAIAIAIGLSLLFTWLGLYLAFVGHWPVSFYIATLSALSYFVCAGINRLREARHAGKIITPLVAEGDTPVPTA